MPDPTPVSLDTLVETINQYTKEITTSSEATVSNVNAATKASAESIAKANEMFTATNNMVSGTEKLLTQVMKNLNSVESKVSSDGIKSIERAVSQAVGNIKLSTPDKQLQMVAIDKPQADELTAIKNRSADSASELVVISTFLKETMVTKSGMAGAVTDGMTAYYENADDAKDKLIMAINKIPSNTAKAATPAASPGNVIQPTQSVSVDVLSEKVGTLVDAVDKMVKSNAETLRGATASSKEPNTANLTGVAGFLSRVGLVGDSAKADQNGEKSKTDKEEYKETEIAAGVMANAADALRMAIASRDLEKNVDEDGNESYSVKEGLSDKRREQAEAMLDNMKKRESLGMKGGPGAAVLGKAGSSLTAAAGGLMRFANIAGMVVSAIPEIISGVITGIASTIEKVFVSIPVMFLFAAGFLMEAVPAFLKRIPDMLIGFIKLTFYPLTKAFELLWDGVKSLFPEFAASVENGWKYLKELFSGGFGDIVQGIKDLLHIGPSAAERQQAATDKANEERAAKLNIAFNKSTGADAEEIRKYAYDKAKRSGASDIDSEYIKQLDKYGTEKGLSAADISKLKGGTNETALKQSSLSAAEASRIAGLKIIPRVQTDTVASQAALNKLAEKMDKMTEATNKSAAAAEAMVAKPDPKPMVQAASAPVITVTNPPVAKNSRNEIRGR
jgi:hypothetical protein